MVKKAIISKLLAASMILAVTPAYAEATVSERLNTLETNLYEIESLLDECKKKGYSTDYEILDYTVIKDFIEYGRDDLENGYSERAEYVADKIEVLYEDVKNNLSAYLNGSKIPKPVKRYKTSDIEIDSMGYKADAVDSDGNISKENLFFNGYMGGIVRKDIEKLPALGMNMVAVETGVWDIIAASGKAIYGGWRKDFYSVSDGTLIETVAGIGKDSSKGLQIVNTGGKAVLRKTLQVIPDTEYEIGCYSLNKSGSGVVVEANGVSLSVYNNASRFSKSSTSFNSGDNYEVSLLIISSGAGENIIDNFYVKEKGTDENLLIDGEFEKDIVKEDGFDIDEGAADKIISTLKRAEKSDVAVDVLISPHYFPTYILNENEEYKHPNSNRDGAKVEWYKERILKVMDEYVSALVPMIKDYPALNSICLTNEPVFNLIYSGDKVIYSEEEGKTVSYFWHKWLYDKYKNIESLNIAHSTSYEFFDEIPLLTALENTPAFYDWKNFNEEMFADWHEGIAMKVKELAPDVKVHAKILCSFNQYDSNYDRNGLLTGTDANLFAEFSDLHGNDAHAYIEKTHTRKYFTKFGWYDYLNTIKEMPIHNTEDHIIKDQSVDYSDGQAFQVSTDLWQGAMHGRSSTIAWVYSRTYDTESLLMDSILHRPDCMSMYGKTSLDLNRLADQMIALQNVEPRVGVLHSEASRIYNRNHQGALSKAYEALLYSGYRASVFDEITLNEDKLKGLELIILPETQYVKDETVQTLKTFVNNGGKIITVGENALKYNDYEKERDESDFSDILKDAISFESEFSTYQLTSPTVEQMLDGVKNAIGNEIKIVNANTGEELSNTEYRYTDYNGKKLINICRYDWGEEVNAEIYINGEKASYMYDLREEERLEDLTVKGYAPRMLYIATDEMSDDGNFEMLYKDGDMYLEGYSESGKTVGYTVIPNGKSAYDVTSLAAMGEVIPAQNGYFATKINLNSKTDATDDFVLYAGNGEIKENKYFTYKKSEEVFRNIFAMYNEDSYEIYWQCKDENVVGVTVSDGSAQQEVAPDINKAVFKSANTKKTYTISAHYSDGSIKECSVNMPVPLMLNLKVLDGMINISGAAQPDDTVQLFVYSGEKLIFNSTEQADNFGSFAAQLTVDDSLIPQDNKLILHIVTSSDTGKNLEFIYTGTLPVHIGQESQNQISFTNYTSRKIENAAVVFAKYLENTMVDCEVKALTIDADESLKQAISGNDGYKTKIFVWDGISSMKPLSKYLEIE